MLEEKPRIRKDLKAKRLELPAAKKSEMDNKIRERLLKYLEDTTLNNIHIYRSLPGLNEVDTTLVIKQLQVTYPDVGIYTPQGNDINQHSQIVKGSLNSAVLPMAMEVIVVPLVGFDEVCNRLGNGGGYYDRFLKNYPHAEKIGIAYELQKVKQLPSEDHDVRLTKIITEDKIYEC